MRMVRQTSIALSLKGTGTRKEEAKEAGKVPLDQLFAEDEDAPLHMTRTTTRTTRTTSTRTACRRSWPRSCSRSSAATSCRRRRRPSGSS